MANMQKRVKSGLLLLSTGIDSPVAGYMMARQGMEISAIHFRNTLSDVKDSEIAVSNLLSVLRKATGQKIPLFISENYTIEERISKECNPRNQCVLCKRMMYRIAEIVAKQEDIDCLVTGENLGQVASQTLDNLEVLDEAVSIPVIRPLIASDKTETITLSKKMGLYELSIVQNPPCPFVPKSPSTKADMHHIRMAEKALDVTGIVGGASARIIRL